MHHKILKDMCVIFIKCVIYKLIRTYSRAYQTQFKSNLTIIISFDLILFQMKKFPFIFQLIVEQFLKLVLLMDQNYHHDIYWKLKQKIFFNKSNYLDITNM